MEDTLRRLMTALTMVIVGILTMAPTPIYMSINDTGFSSRTEISRAEILKPEDIFEQAQNEAFRNRRGRVELRMSEDEHLSAALKRAHRTRKRIRTLALRSSRDGRGTTPQLIMHGVLMNEYTVNASGDRPPLVDLAFDYEKISVENP